MAVDFSEFTQKTSAQSTDYIVGYDVNASGGEKKYTVSTLANAVSSVASLGTVKSVTGTAPISVANGTTTPAISIDTATTSAAGAMAASDKSALTFLQSNSAINVVDSPTIDLDWNASTRTLSAGVSSINSFFTGTNQSLATNGYQKLPGGLIIQWGRVESISINEGVSVNVTFPITFSTIYTTTPTLSWVTVSNNNGAATALTRNQSNTGAIFWIDVTGISPSTGSLFWTAIGQ